MKKLVNVLVSSIISISVLAFLWRNCFMTHAESTELFFIFYTAALVTFMYLGEK